jgi:hypothetical protein
MSQIAIILISCVLLIVSFVSAYKAYKVPYTNPLKRAVYGSITLVCALGGITFTQLFSINPDAICTTYPESVGCFACSTKGIAENDAICTTCNHDYDAELQDQPTFYRNSKISSETGQILSIEGHLFKCNEKIIIRQEKTIKV